MNTIAKLSCGLFALTLLLAGCGSSGSVVPAASDSGGGGLTLNQFDDGQGGTVDVNFSNAVDINDFNEVVGFAEIIPGEPFAAGKWTVADDGAGSVPTALPPLESDGFSAAFAIDDNGNAVGQSSKGALLVAVRWPFADGAPQELPALNAAGNSTAFDVSANGELIVGEAQDAGLVTRAVIWVADAQGEFNGTPVVLPSNIFSSSEGISRFSSANSVALFGNQIWVVGEAEDGGRTSHAALWRSNDRVVFQATDLCRDLGIVANGVSSQGWIVGEIESETATGFTPILWTAAALGIYDWINLAPEGVAVAVNNNDRIVGWSGAAGLATVWTETQVPETLFVDASQAYSLNNNLEPMVVGRNGDLGFVIRVN